MTLELFPKHPDMDAYRVGGAYQPYAVVGRDVRFTDAELAAEYLFVVHGDNTVLEWHHWNGEYRSPQSIGEKMFHFATRPSYDE